MDKCALIRTVAGYSRSQPQLGSGMEALSALRACIAAVQRELRDTAGPEGSTNVDTLEQCLCQVEDILRDKDGEIRQLRDALEESRERKVSREPQRKDHHYESVTVDAKDGTSPDECVSMPSASIPSSPGSGQREVVDELKNRATSGCVGMPLMSPDRTNSITKLEPDHDRLTETGTPPITSASEELGSHISCGNVPEPPPSHATTTDTPQTLTAGRLLGWS